MAKQLLFGESGSGGGGGLDSGTVLWENPNPTARFGAQKVTLSQNYTDFEFIGVVYTQGLTPTNPAEAIVRVADARPETTNITTGALGIKSTGYGARNFLLQNDNEVYFYAYYAAGSTATGDSGAIPQRVIGY